MTTPTIGALIAQAARRFGDKPALVCEQGTRSYRELDTRSDRVAAMLAGLGVGPGERVALVRAAGLDFVEDEFGIYKSGAAEIAVNPRYTLHEQLSLLSVGRPAVVLVDEDARDRAEEFARLPSVRSVIVGEDRDRAIADARATSRLDESGSGEWLWRLHFSSGTTGEPKAAALTQRAFLYSVQSYREAVGGIDPADVFIDPAPLVTAGGWALWANLLSGSTTVVLPRFRPEAFVEATLRHRGSTTLLVPTMISDLVRYGAHPIAGQLRTVLYTASAISEPVLEDALEQLGPVFVQAYSMAETMSALTALSKSDHQVSDPRVRRSAGYPQWGVQLCIRDDEGREVDADQTGTITLRAPGMLREYWDRPDLTQTALRDGWLWSSDVGSLDESGRLHVLDRADDVVISSGFNVYPREVEDALVRHHAVREAAVVGQPDDRVGQIVTAVVVLDDPTVADDELIDFAKTFLATYKVPKVIRRRDEPLPRNLAGKVARREIKQDVAGRPVADESRRDR